MPDCEGQAAISVGRVVSSLALKGGGGGGGARQFLGGPIPVQQWGHSVLSDFHWTVLESHMGVAQLSNIHGNHFKENSVGMPWEDTSSKGDC